MDWVRLHKGPSYSHTVSQGIKDDLLKIVAFHQKRDKS